MRLFCVSLSGNRAALVVCLVLATCWPQPAPAGPPAFFQWRSYDAGGSRQYGVYGPDNAAALSGGSLVQLMYAGADGRIDPPGHWVDDEILAESAIFPDDSLPPPLRAHGYFDATLSYDAESRPDGTPVFVRAWNGTDVSTASRYGDSGLAVLAAGGSMNFARWYTNIAPGTQPPLALTLDAPAVATAGGTYAITARVSPDTASMPLQFEWTATDQQGVIHSTGLEDEVAFRWSATGMKTVRVTARNNAGEVSTEAMIDVQSLWISSARIVSCEEGMGFEMTLSGTSARSRYEFFFTDDLAGAWLLAETALPGADGQIVWTDCGGPGRQPILYYTAGLADDPDGDGLGSSAELMLTVSSPDSTDSDGDGVSDGEEDPDADGLSDRQEYNSPLDPDFDPCRQGSSHPLIADTDNDGVGDAQDAFPLDPSAWYDNDCDGRPNQDLAETSNSQPLLSPDDLYMLEVALAGSGDGMVQGEGIACGEDCMGTYFDHTLVTLIATASPDTVFQGWSWPACGSAPTCAIEIVQNLEVTAWFAPLPGDTPVPTPLPSSTPVPEPTPSPTPFPTPSPVPVPTLPGVVINEIMYNPSKSQGDDDVTEYIELHNFSDEPVDASFLLLGDASGLDPLRPAAGSGSVIPPGGYAIVTDWTTQVYAVFAVPPGAVRLTVDDEALGNGLANGGDVVVLQWQNEVLDSVPYEDSALWHRRNAGGFGAALQRIDPEADGSDPGNWEGSSFTPGARNDVASTGS